MVDSEGTQLALEIIKSGESDAVKQLTRDIFADSELRTRLGAQPEIWIALQSKLSQPATQINVVPLLQLSGNLAASHTATKTAYSGDFYVSLTRIEAGEALRYVYQILANFSFSFGQIDFLPLLPPLKTAMSAVQPLNSSEIGVFMPFIILQRNILENLPLNALSQLEYFEGVWDLLLKNMPDWLGEPTKCSDLLKFVLELAVSSFSHGLYHSLKTKYKTNPAQDYTFTQLIASVVENAVDDAADALRDIEGLDKSIEVSVDAIQFHLVEFTRVLKNGAQGDYVILGQTLVAELRVLNLFLNVFRPQIIDQYPQLLPDLVDTLVAAKAIPARSKLTKRPQDSPLSSSEILPRHFPELKNQLISAISNFVAGNKEHQDLVRERGGLGALLEACVIDENNPFMKEHAILALKYVLAENEANQAFVASMEAQKVVNADELEAAGYEADIVDGNISVKRHN